jgi:hypothetical protein
MVGRSSPSIICAGVNIVIQQLSSTNNQLLGQSDDEFRMLVKLIMKSTGSLCHACVLFCLYHSPGFCQREWCRPLAHRGPATLIYRFPGVMGLLGIVELQQDVFYTISGNFTVATTESTSGSYSIWKIDMRSNGGHTIVSKLVDIPEGVLLNGMAVLNEKKGLVVVGDAGAGVVFTLDVGTGRYSKTMGDPTMKPTSSFPIGINGIKIRGRYLYYATTAQELFSRILINSDDGTAAGPVEGIAKNVFGDDFSLDESGNAYVGENVKDVVAKITPEGVVTVVAGSLNSTLVAGATSTEFGRTRVDRSVLYVTTSGGIGSSAPVEGGKVVAIYT